MMKPILQLSDTEIDIATGFRCRSVWGNSENFQMHYHDYYEIFLTLSDDVIHFVNSKKFILKKNTLVFIRKNDTHYYSKSVRNELSFINIAFSEEILLSMFSFLSDGFYSKELLKEEFPPSIILDDSDKNWLLHQISKLNSIQLEDIKTQKYKSRVLLFQIFTKYFSKFANESLLTAKEIPLWLQHLDNKMHKLENFSKSPEHMVILSGKSRAHLGRTLQKHYGKTIPEYINDLRLNYLANSLINTDLPILDLCFECGFENISWAYTLFRKKYGLSPLKFRNKHLYL